MRLRGRIASSSRCWSPAVESVSPTNPPLPLMPCLRFTRCRGQRIRQIRQMQIMALMIQSGPILGHGDLPPDGVQTTYLYSAVPGDPNFSST